MMSSAPVVSMYVPSFTSLVCIRSWAMEMFTVFCQHRLHKKDLLARKPIFLVLLELHADV